MSKQLCFGLAGGQLGPAASISVSASLDSNTRALGRGRNQTTQDRDRNRDRCKLASRVETSRQVSRSNIPDLHLHRVHILVLIKF